MVSWLSPVILEAPTGYMDALGHSIGTKWVPGRTNFTVGPSLRPSPMGPEAGVFVSWGRSSPRPSGPQTASRLEQRCQERGLSHSLQGLGLPQEKAGQTGLASQTMSPMQSEDQLVAAGDLHPLGRIVSGFPETSW